MSIIFYFMKINIVVSLLRSQLHAKLIGLVYSRVKKPSTPKIATIQRPALVTVAELLEDFGPGAVVGDELGEVVFDAEILATGGNGGSTISSMVRRGPL